MYKFILFLFLLFTIITAYTNVPILGNPALTHFVIYIFSHR